MTKAKTIPAMLGLLTLFGVVLMVSRPGAAQGGLEITGLWQRCSNDGYLVLLDGGQQVNFAGDDVEAGTYAFDGRNLTIRVQWLYLAEQGLRRETPQQVLTLDPQGRLTSGAAAGGVPQCYVKIPFSS